MKEQILVTSPKKLCLLLFKKLKFYHLFKKVYSLCFQEPFLFKMSHLSMIIGNKVSAEEIRRIFDDI